MNNRFDNWQSPLIEVDKLNKLLASGESETVEFKPAFNTNVIETAVAFANTHGGHILIGISDSGHPSGQKFGKEALRDYVNRIANASEPSIALEAKRVEFEGGEVMILFIPEFPLKPVSTRGRCFRRSGSTTRQLSSAEIANMHLHSTGQSMDAARFQKMMIRGKCCESWSWYALNRKLRGQHSFYSAKTRNLL